MDVDDKWYFMKSEDRVWFWCDLKIGWDIHKVGAKLVKHSQLSIDILDSSISIPGGQACDCHVSGCPP